MIRVRAGDRADTAAVLALLDGAVRWLTAAGRAGQWGSEPFSARPDQVRRVEAWAGSGGLRIAELGGVAIGALVAGAAPHYAPAAGGPELYLQGFVTDRARRGVGAVLLAVALAEARWRGVPVLRLDCYAGGDGGLVRYYERAGFTVDAEFVVDGWPGCFLSYRC